MPWSSISLTIVCVQNAVRRIVPAVGEVYESVFNVPLLVSMRAYASESLLVYKRLQSAKKHDSHRRLISTK